MSDDELIELVARKLAGQFMIDDGYGEDSRISAERGEMWRNFKNAALVAIETLRAASENEAERDALQRIAQELLAILESPLLFGNANKTNTAIDRARAAFNQSP